MLQLNHIHSFKTCTQGNDEAIALCMDTCQHRATTDLGSSVTYPATSNYDSGYMATDCSVNPLSCTWNTVYVKYCDGMSFSGNNETVLSGNNANDKDLHFSSHSGQLLC